MWWPVDICLLYNWHWDVFYRLIRCNFSCIETPCLHIVTKYLYIWTEIMKNTTTSDFGCYRNGNHRWLGNSTPYEFLGWTVTNNFPSILKVIYVIIIAICLFWLNFLSFACFFKHISIRSFLIMVLVFIEKISYIFCIILKFPYNEAVPSTKQWNKKSLLLTYFWSIVPNIGAFPLTWFNK